ncbi:ABC-ATPase domain-containing protein [Kiritimatiella glycovorans]|uniref:Putative ATPase of the ABC class n=1 Tax=Kiritimatiella glycovorans TaxID=1307763 RepID=A0A0G3EDF3_9BACT|nr:P-loop domain-containing protein [Kiritimatiella glycovorans]AKJ64511.1 putative ATPase of the ABC class [Kiritimatiella glycovorans]
MIEKHEFHRMLRELDGKPFADYERLIQDCDFGRFVLRVAESGFNAEQPRLAFTLRIPQNLAGFPADLFDSPVRRTALEDCLIRSFDAELARMAQFGPDGTARRHIYVASPGQAILPRTAMLVTKEYVEARIWISLPYKTLPYAFGQDERVIDGGAAERIFFDELPVAVNAGMLYCNVDRDYVQQAVCLMEDATRVRQLLPTRGLVSFIGEGALTARRCLDGTPDTETGEPLMVDEDQMAELEVPNAGTVRGLGIPAGLTVIVCEGGRERRDLIRALSDGIYNHVLGDGREMVVTVSDAVHIGSELGRSIRRMDLSPFYADGDTRDAWVDYSTECADAFESQAASTMEALESGGRVLIFDEDSSSPEFLSGAPAGRGLLEKPERIPISSRARAMVDDLGLSMIVVGSSLTAEYLSSADTVFRFEGNRLTQIDAGAADGHYPEPPHAPAVDLPALLDRSRWVMPGSLDPTSGVDDTAIGVVSGHEIRFGRSTVDLSGVTQIADVHQMNTIGHVLYYARLRFMDTGSSLREVLDLIDRDLTNQGLVGLTRDLRGDLARPRRHEIAAALNRLRAFRVSHATQ